jgi:flagellin-like protein
MSIFLFRALYISARYLVSFWVNRGFLLLLYAKRGLVPLERRFLSGKKRVWINLKYGLIMANLSKGVSPVIASVLLIAFSIIIATIVGTWAMGYTQKELTKIDDQSYCKDVSMQQLEFKYDNTSKQGLIRFQNSGNDIQGYRLYAFNETDQELLKEAAATIKKGDIKTLSFQTTIPGIKEVMIETMNCPMVKLRVNV